MIYLMDGRLDLSWDANIGRWKGKWQVEDASVPISFAASFWQDSVRKSQRVIGTYCYQQSYFSFTNDW